MEDFPGSRKCDDKHWAFLLPHEIDKTLSLVNHFRFIYLCPDFCIIYNLSWCILAQICNTVRRVQVLCICDQIKRSECDSAHSPHGNLLSWSFTSCALSIFVLFFALLQSFVMYIGGHICNAVWRVQMCICDQMEGSKRDPAHSPHDKLLSWSFQLPVLYLSSIYLGF